MEEAERTEQSINETREQYRSVATRGSIIYFVISDLANIDPMYQYSLQYFQSLFNRCIENSEKCDRLDKRLEILLSALNEVMFMNVCRGLFEQHKLLFSFLICTSIMRYEKNILDSEW